MNQTQAQHDSTKAPAEHRFHFRRYLWIVAVVVLAGYLLPFAIERIPGVESYMGSPFSPALEYGYTTNGVNADVVIFGDSAAMINLDPVAMSKALGLKVINLPNTASSLEITHEAVLRHYLAHNKAPKLIVLYLALPTFDYKHMGEPLVIYEGQEMLASHGTAAETLAFARHRPWDELVYPLRFYSVAPITGLQGALLHRPRTPQVMLAQGHFDPMAHHATMPDAPCTLPVPAAYRTASAQDFVAEFTTSATQVLPFVSPVPDCEGSAKAVSMPFPGLDVAPPKIMPRTDYKMDNSMVHLLVESVPEATASLTDAVRAKLRL